MTLEISGTALAVDQLGETSICGPAAASPPIVFLLGCETGAPTISFEGAVAQFRRCGAAIVVSTTSLILGRHAATVAIEFLNKLKENQGNKKVTFGDIMLAVRRELLRKGCVVVLAVNSYGDADCRIN